MPLSTAECNDSVRMVGNPEAGNSVPEYCSVVRQLATRRRFVPSRAPSLTRLPRILKSAA